MAHTYMALTWHHTPPSFTPTYCHIHLNAHHVQTKACTHPALTHPQEGNVDEFVFVAPELGPLAGVLIGPQGGTWYCDEVNVASSRAHRSQRFVCRDSLGDKTSRPAAWLTPVPAEAVVYGSGDAAIILTKVCCTGVCCRWVYWLIFIIIAALGPHWLLYHFGSVTIAIAFLLLYYFFKHTPTILTQCSHPPHFMSPSTTQSMKQSITLYIPYNTFPPPPFNQSRCTFPTIHSVHLPRSKQQHSVP